MEKTRRLLNRLPGSQYRANSSGRGTGRQELDRNPETLLLMKPAAASVLAIDQAGIGLISSSGAY